ncbi:MAG: DUF4386 domain-containing protein [Anaerolineales bacterium]|jgi:hypothetical protein
MNNKKVNSYRKEAIIVGILFIIATVFLFVGSSIYGPVLDTPDYLQVAYPNRITATIGILIEFSCIIAIPLIPVFTFPVLRRHSETLALGYLVFRLFEAVIFVLVDITKLSLIKVSELHLAAESSNSEAIANIGATILGWNEWSWVFYVLIFAIGALIFYTALFQSKLLPRWISVWGLIAAVMMVTSAVLAMFEVALPDAVFGLLVIPIAVQEMVMALWLIIKGFNTRYLEA